MLKIIRNLNFGYILILIGFVFIVSGIEMQAVDKIGNTLLCFDQGCIYVQAVSNCLLGVFTILLGIYLKLKSIKKNPKHKLIKNYKR